MPIMPPSASTSLTRCDLPGPPTAGLQGMAPIVSRLTARRSVLQPNFAAACAASQPACPPPITTTSYFRAIDNLPIQLTHFDALPKGNITGDFLRFVLRTSIIPSGVLV